MDTFVAFYNLYILLLLIFMPNVFLQLWLDFRIIQMEMKEESSSYHQYHACIFFFFLQFSTCSIAFQVIQRLFFSFFQSHYYLDGLSSLGWIRVKIFNSLERFKAIYPCYLFIIFSEAHFLPSGKFQRPKCSLQTYFLILR